MTDLARTPWGGPWLIAGLRVHRKRLAMERARLSVRKGVPEDVALRGLEALDAIIAEIDTQIRDLEFGWEP